MVADDDENWIRIALASDTLPFAGDWTQENWMRLAIESYGVAPASAEVPVTARDIALPAQSVEDADDNLNA
jgi:hypothetical protein